MDRELRIEITLTHRRIEAWLTATLLAVLPSSLGSGETLVLDAAFPAPAATYARLITTGAGGAPTQLSRDGGNTILVPLTNKDGAVAIGLDKPDTNCKNCRLQVNGNAWVNGYADVGGAKFGQWLQSEGRLYGTVKADESSYFAFYREKDDEEGWHAAARLRPGRKFVVDQGAEFSQGSGLARIKGSLALGNKINVSCGWIPYTSCTGDKVLLYVKGFLENNLHAPAGADGLCCDLTR